MFDTRKDIFHRLRCGLRSGRTGGVSLLRPRPVHLSGISRTFGYRPCRSGNCGADSVPADRTVQEPSGIQWFFASQQVFTSSSTTGQIPSRHYVADLAIYEEAFTRAFELFYGPVQKTAVFALLPNYLEREGSSLVYMVDALIRKGGVVSIFMTTRNCYGIWRRIPVRNPAWCQLCVVGSGRRTAGTVARHDCHGDRGMKGHREELPREEFHRLLCDAFSVPSVHSEYGMAELMSQAYSSGEEAFRTPPWMKVIVRDLHDPFGRLPVGSTGGVNLIDLANLYSCSFVQTQDLGHFLYGW